jgi:hypothetical protein
MGAQILGFGGLAIHVACPSGGGSVITAAGPGADRCGQVQRRLSRPGCVSASARVDAEWVLRALPARSIATSWMTCQPG